MNREYTTLTGIFLFHRKDRPRMNINVAVTVIYKPPVVAHQMIQSWDQLSDMSQYKAE